MKHHLVLGDVDEFEAALRQVERSPTPPPPADTFDVATLPASVQEAMQLSSDVRQPILDVVKAIHLERQALTNQHARISHGERLISTTSRAGQLSETRGQRCARALP
jgi:hypothetical protein